MPPIPRLLADRRVLVVDDDADTREILGETLMDAGAEVRTASSATLALVELAAFAPHVLLCDVGLQGDDGYTLIRRIRALPESCGGRVRAAAFTGHARQEDRDRAKAAGFDLHLTKPIDGEVLAKALANLARGDEPAT
jgi:CheY-like chemotaxis protein